MKIKSLKFGELEFSEHDVVRFSEGIPGFPNLKNYIILANEALQPFQYLQAVDKPFLAFALISPYLLDKTYEVILSSEDMHDILGEDNTNLVVYVIVTIPEKVENATANLLAPVVINPTNMRAKQVIQKESRYSVKYPLLSKTECAVNS